MPTPEDQFPRWSAQATLAAGDSTKTIKAAAATGYQLVVTRYAITSVTSAAQAVDLEDTSGTVEVCKLAASMTVNTQVRAEFVNGLALTKAEALILKPAAAGPAMHCWAEGYTKPTTTGN